MGRRCDFGERGKGELEGQKDLRNVKEIRKEICGSKSRERWEMELRNVLFKNV